MSFVFMNFMNLFMIFQFSWEKSSLLSLNECFDTKLLYWSSIKYQSYDADHLSWCWKFWRRNHKTYLKESKFFSENSGPRLIENVGYFDSSFVIKILFFSIVLLFSLPIKHNFIWILIKILRIMDYFIYLPYRTNILKYPDFFWNQ